MFETVTCAPEETEALAARLARELRSGDLVALRGDLGAGKTTFVRGACRALGVTRPVTSPTFTIANRYAGDGVDVAHLDLYRFQGVEPEEWVAVEPSLEDAICFVEWPDVGLAFLPEPRVVVTFGHESPEQRRIAVECADAALLQRLQGC